MRKIIKRYTKLKASGYNIVKRRGEYRLYGWWLRVSLYNTKNLTYLQLPLKSKLAAISIV